MAKLSISVLAALAFLAICAAVYTAWQARQIATRFPPAGQFVEVDGVRIHFTDTLPAGEPRATLVLVHGASGNEAEMRAALGARLVARGYRVISVDRPGHGWSERHRGADKNDPAGQARLIRMALERHGVAQAIPVVHSLAGALGLQLALDHADFISGAVLVSPVTHPWPGGVAAYHTVAASLAGPLFAHTLALPAGQAIMDRALDSVFAPQAPPAGYLARTGVELVLRPQTFRANALDVAGLYDFVVRESARYHRIAIPVAIVAGDSDAIVLTEVHSRNSAKAIANAQLTVLDGVGHAPHWTHPQAVVDAIERLHAAASAGSRPLQSSR